jgi:hypothetical protein
MKGSWQARCPPSTTKRIQRRALIDIATLQLPSPADIDLAPRKSCPENRWIGPDIPAVLERTRSKPEKTLRRSSIFYLRGEISISRPSSVTLNSADRTWSRVFLAGRNWLSGHVEFPSDLPFGAVSLDVMNGRGLNAWPCDLNVDAPLRCVSEGVATPRNLRAQGRLMTPAKPRPKRPASARLRAQIGLADQQTAGLRYWALKFLSRRRVEAICGRAWRGA